MALYAAIIGTINLALFLAFVWKTQALDADVTVATRLAYRALERAHEVKGTAHNNNTTQE